MFIIKNYLIVDDSYKKTDTLQNVFKWRVIDDSCVLFTCLQNKNVSLLHGRYHSKLVDVENRILRYGFYLLWDLRTLTTMTSTTTEKTFNHRRSSSITFALYRVINSVINVL